MMIPGTRRRFENYFSIEEQSLHYTSLGQRDGMTGLYNKAHLLALLDECVQAALLAKKQLAFIMMDVDHFQKYNDLWGYPEGDKVLFFLAKLIRQCLRESDIAARYGGGEFAIILPGGTLPSSVLVAERIRQTFEKQTYTLGKDKAVTLSLGLAFLRAGDTVAKLIHRADEALYRAKANGRNRTDFEVAP
jgi:diguanylate cyclase (GGDEF)-like protein